LAGRDPDKLGRLATELRRRHSTAKLRTELVDLSSHESIAALGKRLEGPLDVLINDAAVAPPQRRETDRGIEMVLATNVLGYVWMTKELCPALARGDAPRVVNVASYWAGDLDMDDLEFVRRRYDNNAAYRQSKQANRMLTVAWAERLGTHGITVNGCHPGDVNSRLSNDLGFGGSESPAQGAATPLWLATSSDVAGQTGGYYEHGRRANCQFSTDRTQVERLAQICDGYR
jgi:NAD(P)-dependent dehydrogenase (short-subunit alcohol dehydrogenase family)